MCVLIIIISGEAPLVLTRSTCKIVIVYRFGGFYFPARTMRFKSEGYLLIRKIAEVKIAQTLRSTFQPGSCLKSGNVACVRFSEVH